MQRLLRVFCVVSKDCECKKQPSVMLATDSFSYAEKYCRELKLDAEMDICEICKKAPEYHVESVEYQRKHFFYEGIGSQS